jgi:hypothetical protein
MPNSDPVSVARIFEEMLITAQQDRPGDGTIMDFISRRLRKLRLKLHVGHTSKKPTEQAEPEESLNAEAGQIEFNEATPFRTTVKGKIIAVRIVTTLPHAPQPSASTSASVRDGEMPSSASPSPNTLTVAVSFVTLTAPSPLRYYVSERIPALTGSESRAAWERAPKSLFISRRKKKWPPGLVLWGRFRRVCDHGTITTWLFYLKREGMEADYMSIPNRYCGEIYKMPWNFGLPDNNAPDRATSS